MAMYILLLAAAIGIMAMLRNCSTPAAGTTDRRAGGDTLNVAIEISPIGVSTKGDTLGGFYYDMIRGIAAQNNISLHIDGFTNTQNALDRLEEHRYDLVIADIPMTADLRTRHLFTVPVIIDRQVLVQLRDSTDGSIRIKNQQDLAGDTVYVPVASPLKSRLHNLARELGDTIYIMEDPDYASEQLVMLTALGEIPNAIVNSHMARSMLKDYPELDASIEISFNQFQSWIVARQDTTLLDSLNHCIERYKNSPAYSRLYDRYFK